MKPVSDRSKTGRIVAMRYQLPRQTMAFFNGSVYRFD